MPSRKVHRRKFSKFTRGAIVAAGLVVATTTWHAREPIAYQADIWLHPERAAMERELVAMVRHNPPAAFARMAELLAAEPVSRNTCHGIAHKMGHEAFESFGFARAMSYQNGICGSGYAHGVVEAKFGVLGGGDLAEAAKGACGQNPTESCAHGVGHGLMVASGLDVPTALSWCETVPESVRRDCYDGVFMHALDPEEGGAPKDVARYAEDPVGLCGAQADLARGKSCAFYLPRVFGNGRLADAVTACASLPGTLQVSCEAGIGHSAMKGSVANPAAGVAVCDSIFGDEAARDVCAEGGMEYLVFSAFAEAAANEEDICGRFEGEDKKMCEKVAGGFRE